MKKAKPAVESAEEFAKRFAGDQYGDTYFDLGEAERLIEQRDAAARERAIRECADAIFDEMGNQALAWAHRRILALLEKP